METKEKGPEQADLTRQARRLDRKTLAPLDTLTLVALLGTILMNAFAFVRILLVEGIFVLPIVIISVVTLLAAGAIAARWRWAPLLGAFVILIVSVLVLAAPQNTYDLTHPAQFLPFIILVLFFAFALVALVAGVGATVQNSRRIGYQHHLPRWSGISLSGLAGIVVGICLVSLIVAAVPQTGAVSTSSNGEPAIHMTGDNFVQNVILVPKGSKLLVVNDSSVEHILQNGMWDANGTPHSLVEPGAPILHNIQITGGSQEIGPFTTAGVYHIYCTIHRAMNLTIVVE